MWNSSVVSTPDFSSVHVLTDVAAAHSFIYNQYTTSCMLRLDVAVAPVNTCMTGWCATIDKIQQSTQAYTLYAWLPPAIYLVVVTILYVSVLQPSNI